MKKVISLFQRNYDGDRLVRDEVVPGAEWVLAGREGRPTVKRDGTSCLVAQGRLFKRYDAKAGRTPPKDWQAAQPAPDPQTGHWPGWLPVGKGPEDAWHREAFEALEAIFEPGTYELCGPKVQRNPYGFAGHVLIRHGSERLIGDPRTFEAIREYLAGVAIEGIVWHHPDGRMVKIKARDFGLRWPR